ncbi:MAG: hypothetical protein A2735_00525 [Candidatus Yanofskybacteria bacterium RIFCSPHIGHO2_01_FULL_41_21]|uniref:Class I SAM-dependent methyltransferase n=1 Tax=Candidatus Yanofskybacteria bacterium RIFCSPHIGHO2_01_FULL_41_21 TaxID=1802660 RepID=A0A1F8ECX1_9BACT|nr:MAG: hypothetical protein A2735_00525 [Candidatus Yanofskybacteria bacterium RIFCSPHIGHO2_01_FULL_41_21]
MNKEEIKTIMDVEGYTSLKEGLFLYSLAGTLINSPVMVEIGSWKGRSTIWLASGLRDGTGSGRVVAVDHGVGDSDAGIQQTAEIFSANIKKSNVAEMITTIFKKSEEAISNWSDPVDMLFIDGAHDYENVKRDFAWEEFLKDGGWLVMHDVLNPAEGPARMFLERVIKTNGFKNFGTVDSILFAQKGEGLKRYDLRKTIIGILLRFCLILTKVNKKLPKNGLPKKIVRILMKDIVRGLITKVANFKLVGFDKIKTELTQ